MLTNPRRTRKALIDNDNITGRKVINQYEVIEEIGRGMHGKVKLARNLETGDNVAIKIIPRFSKKRRLGKVTAMSPEDKTKKEIAILKKIRHPNVVALLEVIDDPELKKIYMVLEHAELGEVCWRKKGLPHVCQYERRRAEREMLGVAPTQAEIEYDQLLEQRLAVKELKRAHMLEQYNNGPADYWSVEHGAAEDGSSVAWSRISSKDDFAALNNPPSRSASPTPFHPHSRRQSSANMSTSVALSSSFPPDVDEDIWGDDIVTPGPLTNDATAPLDGTMYGAYADEGFRRRSPSMADSIISHMSSIDYNPHVHDAFADDYSYVPCFTFDQARNAFRDTVLGLEYLHYQGVVHRDIKPANLLWSKDHRVKISDFGVSYFGRPIRDGEPDEPVSESEARDFDNDLELAKTVGTPAFFAPELCYTDLEKEQPKVSEQIDVWSLGVTLYCLIFARIPFLAEDEFQMFRKIANDDVYIPRKRLAPVDPSTSPTGTSLYKRQNVRPYRDDNDIVYEDVDNLLYDLLRQMFVRNPEKRIRLRDIKRHPWVVQGMANPVGWLDDTDPSRPSCGRKIQVDEREMSSAVVPLTFLERARSVVKKAVGKVIHPLGERSDSKSRHRATSSVASSAGDNLFRSTPATPHHHSERRAAFFSDDYFAGSSSPRHMSPAADQTSGPSTTVPGGNDYDPMATVLMGGDVNRGRARGLGESPVHEGPRLWQRPTASHSRLSQHALGLTSSLAESHSAQSTPAYDGSYDRQTGRGILRMARDSESVSNGTSRSQSKERGVFASTDKRAHAHVGLSKAIVAGNVSAFPAHSSAHVSPLSSSPMSGAYQHGQPKSDPDFQSRRLSNGADRPHTASQISKDMAKSAAVPLTTGTSLAKTPQLQVPASDEMDPAGIPCPPSPHRDVTPNAPEDMLHKHGVTINKSTSADSMEALATPLTSPSETTSPIAAGPPPKMTSDRILAFQSDPSLPALLSNASSVSADMEAELLGKPGVVSTQASLLESTDSLTSSTLTKEITTGYPTDAVFQNPPAMESGPLPVQLDSTTPETPEETASDSQLLDEDDDGDDSGDDGFWLMAKSKKRPTPTSTVRKRPFEARRRDTAISNISVASDETAKRVVLHPEEEA